MPLARVTSALLLIVILAIQVAQRADAQQADDFDIANGHFYSQARGSSPPGTGYAVTNDSDVPFWTWFQRYGGVQSVGYPVSHRFIWKGFISQAYQKVVFQWRPDQGGAVAFVNVFDELTAYGKDDWLAVVREVPNSEKWSEDNGKAWPEIVQNHYRLLDRDLAIKDAFLSAPDPVSFNGLPMSYADLKNVAVLRGQRKVFQRWKVDLPWAKAGQVTVANGGDVGKEAGLYPQAAVEPKAPGEIPSLVQPSSTPTATPGALGSATPAATATPLPPGSSPTFTAPTGATPNPLAGQCDDIEHHSERSILRNTSFDGGYPGGVPEGWTSFSRGSVQFGEESGREKFDRASWRISGQGDFTGGGYQIVTGLKPGRWYQAFYATGQQVWGTGGKKDGSLPLLREIGLDPTGGTNPDAATVIWGRTAGGQRDKDLNKYGGWKTLANENNPLVSMIAVTDKMTMFIRVKGWPDVEKGDAWIDSAYFYEACDPAFKR